jgi:hypothetical protein
MNEITSDKIDMDELEGKVPVLIKSKDGKKVLRIDGVKKYRHKDYDHLILTGVIIEKLDRPITG